MSRLTTLHRTPTLQARRRALRLFCQQSHLWTRTHCPSAPCAAPWSAAGELQRVAITLCLGQPANVYLIDEPSAYLDSEQRIMAAKVIKR